MTKPEILIGLILIFSSTLDFIKADEYEECNRNTDCTGNAGCATIYQLTNGGGWAQCLTFPSNDSCVTLNSWWTEDTGKCRHCTSTLEPEWSPRHSCSLKFPQCSRVSGVDSHDTGCLRLHVGRGCSGAYVEIENGDSSQLDLSRFGFNERTQSISLCARDFDKDERCTVQIVFSDTLNELNTSSTVTEIMNQLDTITSYQGLSAIKQNNNSGADSLLDGIKSLSVIFNTTNLVKAIISAKIEPLIAPTAASYLSAKIHVISRRLTDILTNSNSETQDLIDLSNAVHSCEEVHKLFEASGYLFSQNKLVFSPHLVAFSTIYLTLAHLHHKFKTDKTSHSGIVGDMRELAELNKNYMKAAINLRKGFLQKIRKAKHRRYHYYMVADELECQPDIYSLTEGCRLYPTFRDQFVRDTCYKEILKSVEAQIRNFFQPLIAKVRAFPGTD